VAESCTNLQFSLQAASPETLGYTLILPRILNLVTRCKWVVSFTPRLLYPWAKSPGIHRIGDWAGSRDGLDAVAKKKKIPAHAGNRIPVV